MGLFRKSNEDKGLDCTTDEDGNEYCKVMTRHRNKKLATGSDFSIELDDNCNSRPGRFSVFAEDETLVQRKLKQAESECKRRRSQ